MHRCRGYRPRHVCIAERDLAIVHVPIGEQATGPAHGAGECPLPIHGERSTGDRAQQVEVQRREVSVDVRHPEHREANHEGHRAGEMRLGGAHVHLAQPILEHVRIAHVIPDGQLHLPAAGMRERRIHPGNVVHRDRVRPYVHIIVRRRGAAPRYAALRMSGRSREIEVMQDEEDGVAEDLDRAGRVAQIERRIILLHAHVADRNQFPRTVRICKPHVRRSQLPLRPAARLLDPLARATPFVISVVERDLHRAVTPRALERIRR